MNACTERRSVELPATTTRRTDLRHFNTLRRKRGERAAQFETKNSNVRWFEHYTGAHAGFLRDGRMQFFIRKKDAFLTSNHFHQFRLKLIV